MGFGLTRVFALASLVVLSGCASSNISKTSDGSRCKTTYSQIYQPPLKIGGAGRVLNIPNGQICDPVILAPETEKPDPGQPPAPEPWMRTAHFSSLPSGSIVTFGYGGNILSDDFTPIGGCFTPCSLKIDSRKPVVAYAEMSNKQGEAIPIAFNPREKQGIQVYFTRTPPLTITLSPLSVVDFSVEAGNAIEDKAALPLVRTAPIMPFGALRSGYCNMKFDVSMRGVPTNIQATDCAHDIFRAGSIESVARWYFAPRTKNGKPMGVVGVETKITYKLADKHGKLIP